MKIFTSFFILLISTIFANSNGPGGNYANNAPNYNNCTSCHSGTVNSGNGTVSIAGLPDGGYVPGETYSLTLSVTGTHSRGYGFQMASQIGSDNAGTFSLGSSSENAELNGNQVQHSTRTISGEWVVDWLAPASDVGDITFSFSGLATGGTSGYGGDNVYTGSVEISAEEILYSCIASDGTDGILLWGQCYSITGTDKLNLSGSGIVGIIPEEIGLLTSLSSLDLSSNNLSGTIPSAVGNLTNLSYLNLSMNNLSGAIPGAIGNLINLDSLDLSYNVESILGNPISGIDSIPSQISSLDNMRYLNLSFCYLNNFPNEISNLSSLEELNIAGNKWLHTIGWMLIGSDSASSIFSTIFNLSSLKKIKMARSYMTGTLPPGISNLENLEILDLTGNFLSGQLPGDFWELENLKVFSAGSMVGEWAVLIKNSFYGQILDSINSLQNLEFLNITNNEFSGIIPEDLFEHPNLKQITFSNNLFTGSIPSSVCNTLDSGDSILWDPYLEQISGTFFNFNGNMFCPPYPECLVLDCTVGDTGSAWPPGFNCIGNQDTTNCASMTLNENTFLKPNNFKLHQNYPNPFNPTTQIRYELPFSEYISIDIYNVNGHKIKSLIKDSQQAGAGLVSWDATNDLGQPVSAGMYIYSIQAGAFRMTKKMILLK